jgi:hypothetical protein
LEKQQQNEQVLERCESETFGELKLSEPKLAQIQLELWEYLEQWQERLWSWK